VNRAYFVNLPGSSVGALRSRCVPVYGLRSFDCGCRIRIDEISGKGLALPVTRLLWTHGLWNRPSNHQFTQLEDNLSNDIDVAIGSLRVLV
jgi:hypothetical protein